MKTKEMKNKYKYILQKQYIYGIIQTYIIY